MANASAPASVDAYLADLPAEVRAVLEELRELIRSTVPEVSEGISYAIPTFYLGRRYLVYLAGWRKHVSLYPVGDLPDGLREELAPYQTGKGTLQFPLGRPLPLDLIRRFVAFRADQVKAAIS